MVCAMAPAWVLIRLIQMLIIGQHLVRAGIPIHRVIAGLIQTIPTGLLPPKAGLPIPHPARLPIPAVAVLREEAQVAVLVVAAEAGVVEAEDAFNPFPDILM